MFIVQSAFTIFAFLMMKKMKIGKFIVLGAAAALILAASCKKDDDEDSTKPYLDGTLSFDMPGYVLKGETYTLTPKGVTNPLDGKNEDEVGYYWYTSWNSSVKDTTKTETGTGDGAYTFTVPEEVGNFSVSCLAFADECYSSSLSATFYVVDPTIDSTITDGGYTAKDASFTDLRDGAVYYTAEAGGKTWMKNNLHYAGSGAPYENSNAMDAIFGRFYTWNEAVEACPDGWRLPSDADFAALATSVAPQGTVFKAFEEFPGVAGNLMVNAKFVGERMWEYWPQVDITNKTGFCALPVGYAIYSGSGNRFVGINTYAMFWTSDTEGENGFYRYIHVQESDIHIGKGDKDSFRATVRCVKASEN